MVRNHGPWDYKQGRAQFANFDNFHYGAVGAAAGIPDGILLRGQVLHRFLPGQAILSNLQNSRVIITTVMTQSISYG
ncbi:polymorphic toxin type 44 domain-containing protein [Enterobacter quasihormaechei]|uniref:polymorphic toxin type 44 domain-containing protein n=1 Tax=Enterobacter quasihormaechei TaxID=2529382 RepID=UPI002F3E5F03